MAHDLLSFVFIFALVSCSNGTEIPRTQFEAAAPSAVVPNTPGDSETPATGDPQRVADWLASGAYRSWRCESVAHEARSPSPHGKNRVCNNRKIAEHGAGEFPIGAASVKEIYDDLGALKAQAIGLKVGAGAASAWVWFEIGGRTVVKVNARGDTREASACSSCHAEAGIDREHSGHDFVYTIVPAQK
jgi:hypothetical protein